MTAQVRVKVTSFTRDVYVRRTDGLAPAGMRPAAGGAGYLWEARFVRQGRASAPINVDMRSTNREVRPRRTPRYHDVVRSRCSQLSSESRPSASSRVTVD